jgi:hypothetical protein
MGLRIGGVLYLMMNMTMKVIIIKLTVNTYRCWSCRKDCIVYIINELLDYKIPGQLEAMYWYHSVSTQGIISILIV